MKKASMSAATFNRLLDATKAFCSKTNVNRCYLYIKLDFHADTSEVVAVAVDGYRMSVEHAVAQADEDFSVYVQSNIRLPKKSTVEFELADNEVIIRCDGFMFGYQQPCGEFIEWQNVIPTSEPQFKIAFNGDYLLSALQAAKASVGGTYKTPVILEFRSPLEPIILRTNKNDVKMVLPVRMKSDD